MPARVFGISARNLKHPVIEHYHSQRPKGDARSDQNFIHIVDTKAARLFDPIFDEGIAQSVFGLRLGEIRAFDDETIFAHFFWTFEWFFF